MHERHLCWPRSGPPVFFMLQSPLTGNYKPVSLVTIISKLFEHYILTCVSPLLATTDNQFGFKPKHATDM